MFFVFFNLLLLFYFIFHNTTSTSGLKMLKPTAISTLRKSPVPALLLFSLPLQSSLLLPSGHKTTQFSIVRPLGDLNGGSTGMCVGMCVFACVSWGGGCLFQSLECLCVLVLWALHGVCTKAHVHRHTATCK